MIELDKKASRVWTSIRNKSREDRMFFDNIALMVWCECKAGCSSKSDSADGWADMMLPCYSGGEDAVLDEGLGMYFNTPRRKLSASQLCAIQGFIASHTFRSVTDAKEQMRPYFGDCIATALNTLQG